MAQNRILLRSATALKPFPSWKRTPPRSMPNSRLDMPSFKATLVGPLCESGPPPRRPSSKSTIVSFETMDTPFDHFEWPYPIPTFREDALVSAYTRRQLPTPGLQMSTRFACLPAAPVPSRTAPSVIAGQWEPWWEAKSKELTSRMLRKEL
jgi:hypothetical protein